VPRSFATSLLSAYKGLTLDGWLDQLPRWASDAERGRRLADGLRGCLEPPAPDQSQAQAPASLTYGRTARRGFELRYWRTIRFLAEGRYLNKNNADCVRDPVTQHALTVHHRQLELLGDYLLDYYRQAIAAHGMSGRAWVGEVPFVWQTDFDFSWMGGWLNNQRGKTHERDLLVVVPGRDRSQAVIMADHYDTAYMEDRYKKGPRLAAAGADDNCSATAALMLGAPVFLELSRKGLLACDVWIVHLTGEEFPADSLGARHLCQGLVEGSLRARRIGGRPKHLGDVMVRGVYVLDMVAHNNDRHPDIFQMAPGTGRQSLWLAYQAHRAAETWNAATAVWNRWPARREQGRGRRSKDSRIVPAIARHPELRGEVRVHFNPKSTLFNTDGQVFSDAGVPVVLFMENYDINRQGYHDSHDTMENIDLDYGSAVAAIAIEAVARAASEGLPK